MTQQPTKPVIDECQKAFEHWVTDSHEYERAAMKNEAGKYTLMQTHLFWTAWKDAWDAAQLKQSPIGEWMPIERADKEVGKWVEGFLDTDMPVRAYWDGKDWISISAAHGKLTHFKPWSSPFAPKEGEINE